MTSEELKEEIDLAITTETTPASITPTDVGDTLKLMVDYVDQLAVSKTVKKTISHAELLSLKTSPIEILPATANKAYLPIQVFLKYINNSGWGVSGAPWLLKINTSTVTSFNTQIGAGTVKEEFRLAGNPTNSDTFFNKSLTLEATLDLETPTDPTTTAVIYVNYFEINS
jgi:hypothetical protein